VGHKAREHAEANVKVGKAERMGAEVFGIVRAQVGVALQRAALRRAAHGGG
jgi:hypothetical protein